MKEGGIDMANARAAKKAARAKEAQTKAAEVKEAEAATEVKAVEIQTACLVNMASSGRCTSQRQP